MAKLDWILAYQNALSGEYGDQSAAVIERIKQVAGADFEEAMAKGYVAAPTTQTTKGNNETGEFEREVVLNTGLDWSKLPALPTIPKGTVLYNIGGRAGAERSGKELGFINDPNYGLLAVGKEREEDLVSKILPAIALTFSGGALAAGITGGLGLTGFGKTFASSLVKGGLSSAFGRTPSPLSFASPFLKPSFIDFIKGSGV